MAGMILGEGFAPDIAIDVYGRTHMVYAEKVEDVSKYGIFYKLFEVDGASSPPKRLSLKSQPYSQLPKIALLGDVIRVVWTSSPSGATKATICLAESTNLGKTWRRKEQE